MVANISNKTKCVDDTLLWADTIEESYFQAIQWLDVCGPNGIILNPEKFVFRSTHGGLCGLHEVLVWTGQPGGLRIQHD